MPHSAVGALGSQDLAEKREMAHGLHPAEKPDSLTFGVEEHAVPAPMEGIDGAGTICQGGMPRGSGMAEKPNNPISDIEKCADPAPMEGIDASSMISQGRMPCGPDMVEEPNNPASDAEKHTNPSPIHENLGSIDSDTPMDEAEDVDKTGAECPDEDQCSNEDQPSDEDGCLDEDRSAGSAAEDESRSMAVDGSDSDVDKIEVRRQSSRLQERSNHSSGKHTGASKPKPRHGPKALPRLQHQPKPEVEKPFGKGTQLDPINLDFLQEGSLWDPDGLDTYVSCN